MLALPKRDFSIVFSVSRRTDRVLRKFLSATKLVAGASIVLAIGWLFIVLFFSLSNK
jgi:hypothetical protein